MGKSKIMAVLLALVVGLGLASVATAEAAPRVSKSRKARPTFEQYMWHEVNKVPGARSVQWVVWDLRRYRQDGMVPLGLHENKAYIDPRTPVKRLPYVVRHEYFHVLQERVYPYNTYYDPLAHLGGSEVMADCGARVLGYRGRLSYVRSCNRAQLDGARRILNGQPA